MQGVEGLWVEKLWGLSRGGGGKQGRVNGGWRGGVGSGCWALVAIGWPLLVGFLGCCLPRLPMGTARCPRVRMASRRACSSAHETAQICVSVLVVARYSATLSSS